MNCVVLAMDYEGISPELEATLMNVNMACTYIFMVECAIKLKGLGFKGYGADPFNLFDGFIVMIR